MTRHHPSDLRAALLQHRRLNRLQTGLLVLPLVGIATAAGSLLFGEGGFWLALFAVAGALLLEPAAASALTLRLYRARALHPHEAPEIWAMLRELSVRAGVPATPVPHYVPSGIAMSMPLPTAPGALPPLLSRMVCPAGEIPSRLGCARIRRAADRIARLMELTSQPSQTLPFQTVLISSQK